LKSLFAILISQESNSGVVFLEEEDEEEDEDIVLPFG
jgi:hypothetical protein